MFGLTFPTTILFGQILGGTRAFIINIVLMTILASMIYGFYKRKAYTFDLSIGFFGFTALNAFISLLLIESSNYSIFKPLMLISFLSLASINSVVIWYILHERKFFYAKYFRDKAIHHKDKVFVYTLIAFWCITLLIGLTLGVEFYKTSTKIVDETIVELKEKYPAGEFICYNKESPQKDICILVAVATHQKQDFGHEW